MSSQALTAQAEQLFRHLFEQASLGIAVEDLDGKLVLANPALCSMLGYREDELCGMSCSEFANSKDSQDDWALFQQLRAGVIARYSLEKRYVRKDGTQLWGRLNVSLLKNGDGESSPLVFAFVENITEHKRADEALRESEERFRLAAQAGKMFAYEWDTATDAIVRSGDCAETLGIEKAAHVTTGQQVLAKVYPDDRENVVAAEAALSPEKPHLQVSHRMIRPDGSVIWVERTSHAHFDEQGKVLRIVGMVADITERKVAERELALAHDRLRLAMESGKAVGWEWDLRSGRDTWFGDLQTMFGIGSDVFIGRTEDFYRYVHPEDRQLVAKTVADARQSRKPYAAEFRVVRADGTVRWVAAEGNFYYSRDGVAERMLGMAVDITERRHAEESLRLFRKLLDESTDAIEVLDPETLRFLDVNERACRDLGYTRDELLSLSVRDIDPVVDESLLTSHRTELEVSGFLQFETVHRRKDGSTYPVEINLKRVVLDRTYSVGIVRDITERKRIEEAVRQKDTELMKAQRLAQVGSWQWDVAADAVVWSEELYRIMGRDPNLPAVNFKEPPQLFTAESWERLSHGVDETLRTGAPYELDLEVVRPDGATMWVRARGEGQRDATGRVVRLRGTAQDITERKLAEAGLANVNRRLIEAQEQERTRIARELHDDFAQRLALLAIELEQLHQDPSNLPEIRSRMGELQKQAHEIATDIQTLSHELHSARLQYLGIVAAMRASCQAFGEHTKVTVDFKSHDLPSPLSPDISLCFFRVLQEALHNSAKHSGVRHVEVQLWGTPDEVHLTVSDSGTGFDSEAAKQSRGLGLISMEERLKLMKGTLSIESQPKRGTTIHARVPLSSENHSMRATG